MDSHFFQLPREFDETINCYFQPLTKMPRVLSTLLGIPVTSKRSCLWTLRTPKLLNVLKTVFKSAYWSRMQNCQNFHTLLRSWSGVCFVYLISTFASTLSVLVVATLRVLSVTWAIHSTPCSMLPEVTLVLTFVSHKARLAVAGTILGVATGSIVAITLRSNLLDILNILLVESSQN